MLIKEKQLGVSDIFWCEPPMSKGVVVDYEYIEERQLPLVKPFLQGMARAGILAQDVLCDFVRQNCLINTEIVMWGLVELPLKGNVGEPVFVMDNGSLITICGNYRYQHPVGYIVQPRGCNSVIDFDVRRLWANG